MKFLFTLSFLLLFFNINAQNKSLLISNSGTEKQIKITEGKRVRVKTFGKKRLSGKLKIIDDHSISVKGTRIKLNEIEKIKKHPLAISLPLSLVSGFYGSALIITGTAIAIVEPRLTYVVIPLFPIGAGLLYSAYRSPNVLKGYSSFKNWKYSVINN